MTIDEWLSQPDRACSEDYRYSEQLLAMGPGSKQERERMAAACLACPVYLDCLEDVIAAGKAWEFHEIQTGDTEPTRS